jgi:hypothetical protein
MPRDRANSVGCRVVFDRQELTDYVRGQKGVEHADHG